MMRRVSPEVVAGILAGALSGVAGALLFATLHALIIVPIWNRMTSGLVFGAVAGAAAGWAFAECYPEAIRTRTKRGVAFGAGFGALLWVAVAPVTGADAILRAVGLAPRYELFAFAVAVTIALIGGAALGWLITRRIRGAIAGAAAGLLLTIAMAGPVPVGRSTRALRIFWQCFRRQCWAGLRSASSRPRFSSGSLAGESARMQHSMHDAPGDSA